MDDPKPEPEINPRNVPDSAEGESDRSLIGVGIGASAGGLEAFTELLAHLPLTTGMAFILVQHLDPHHQSALQEILSAKTSMPVIQVQSNTPINPHPVY